MASGKGGRPRKAPELKVVTGTFRPDRDEKVNLDVPLGPMIAPLHLSELARELFASIAGMLEEQKRSSPHYAEHVALLAQRLEQIQRWQAVLDVEGDTYKTKAQAGGWMVRARPEVKMLSDAMRHAQSLINDLMLNPSAALRLASGHKPEDSPFDDF
jgi:P27 family predicted phage terminase small subunit